MINWLTLFFQVLWIAGAAVWLAKLSYQRWLGQQRASRQQKLAPRSPLMLTALNVLIYLMIGIGLIGVNEAIWVRLGWIMVVALALLSEYHSYRDRVLSE